MKLIISLMSDKLKQLVSYVKGSELTTVMDAQFIPIELKGTRDKHAFPSDLIPMDQAKGFDFDEKFLDHFYKTFKIPRTNKA